MEQRGISPLQARMIASLLAGRLKVRIEASDKGWHYNYQDQTIYYQEADLKDLSEEDVIANLMHEAGHAKYSTNYAELTWEREDIPEDHKNKLHKLVNCIEDFRVEDRLREYYPYAIDYLPLTSFKTYAELDAYRTALLKEQGKVPKYMQYCFAIYAYLAGLEMEVENPDVIRVAQDTYTFAEAAREATGTQGILQAIERTIYDSIKPFLDEYQEPRDVVMPLMAVAGNHEEEYPSYQELYAKIRPLISPTVASLARILTDNKFDRYEGKHRSGRVLNERKLYKHRLQDYRLFQRLEEAKNKDYVFSLVIDESGSMRGDKTIEATKSAILFAHVLDRLSIPYSIHGFNTTLRTYKKPQELLSKKTERQFEGMMSNTQTEDAGYNNDGMAVVKFSEQMKAYQGKKVMIVFSDGLPAEIGEGMDYPLRESLKKVERYGIEPVGIGILSSDVKTYYETSLIVRDLTELPKALVAELKHKLRA